MVLAVPLIDTGASVVRRFIRRQPVFAADRHHLHHRLLDRGLTPRQVALLLYGACGIGAIFALLMSWPHNGLHGLLLVAFCLSAWLGLRLTGYVEFDTARHLVLTGTFRHIVNARLFVDGFEKKAALASSPEEYWALVKEAANELECPQVRMSFCGRVFEMNAGKAGKRCSVIRIPLGELGYVNFKCPLGASVKHAVTVHSLISILQRSVDGPLAPAIAQAELFAPDLIPVPMAKSFESVSRM